MFVYDNGKVNVLAENRCANTSMHRYFNIPTYVSALNRRIRNTWMTNPSEKIVVMRHPYQRIRSAIEYCSYENKKFYGWYRNLSKEERQRQFPKLFSFYDFAITLPNDVLIKRDILGHCEPYMQILIGLNFRVINFDRISEYLDVREGAVTNSTDKSFSDRFLEFFKLEDLEFEKKLYDQFMISKKEISPEEWKSLTKQRDDI